MRDAVTVKLGGADYRLLPTFAVVDAFEDRHGSLMGHLHRYMDLTATLPQRATLLLEAIRAGYLDEGKSPDRLQMDGIKKVMFEAGYWSDELIRAEIELCERLLYTPEQYTAKKTAREKEHQAQMEAMDLLSAFAPSSEQQAQP